MALCLRNDLQTFFVLIQSKPNKGSTFKITIDAGSRHAVWSEEGLTRRFAELPVGTLPLVGIKVLLADDFPDNQVLVSRLLKLAGATVDVASNGKEAQVKAMKDHYDVILMDLQMPVMDGYEATRDLRNSGYHGKIVALSAHAQNDVRERCLHSGFDDHISKPVDRERLIERVSFFSGRAKSR
ncbi:MAG: hypothetical protein C5B49_07230 [Bdellovibrio sp.]|nr:MAG: hypothetical protein C5B49_07230 [Bdellovibrio sp.]